MRLSIITEHRFHRTPDGAVWTSTANSYTFWTRYLSVFSGINVVARILDVDREGHGWLRADGDRVHFSAIPYYVGPYQYALRWHRIRSALQQSILASDAVIMRVPSFLANTIEPFLRKRGQPYGLEVVGDPYDGFDSGAIRHLLRPLLRISMPHMLRRQCSYAAGVAYVTKRALQERYPSRGFMIGVSDATIPGTCKAEDRKFVTHYSSLSLAPGQLSGPRPASAAGTLKIICVGMLEQFYKGHDVLLHALGECALQRLDFRLVLVGDGRIRPELETLAVELGISTQCEFQGQLVEGRAVVAALDQADLFVLPSRTEGLPRALIEAMARGLPCIATAVGGIPELLSPEDMVAPGDAGALAAKILEVAASAERREAMSHRNVAVAQQYAEEILKVRREGFYEHIHEVTEASRQTRREKAAA